MTVSFSSLRDATFAVLVVVAQLGIHCSAVGTVTPADLNLLGLFVSVVDTGSFSESARRLNLPKSSVSRGIRALESAVGTQLLHRTTRRVAVSTAGAGLYERVAGPLGALHHALGTLPEQKTEPSGELRVTAPVDLGTTVLAEMIALFKVRYPAVRVDMRLTNRVVDVRGEGFDMAIRASRLTVRDGGLVARKLLSSDLRIFAAPTYIAKWGAPRTAADAPDHRWIAFRSLPHLQSLGLSPASAYVTCDDFLFVREVLRTGAGVGFLPSFLAQSDLAGGTLVRVMPRFAARGPDIVALYARPRPLARNVEVFRDFLIEAFRVRAG